MPTQIRYDEYLQAKSTAHILENQCKTLIEAHHNQRRQIRDLAMTHNQFLELVREMRHNQRQYFKYRTQSFLQRSKELEKQVDQHLADSSPTNQTSLF